MAADGTQVETLIDNLLAESHIRYGGYGGYDGIAYHHVADNYITRTVSHSPLKSRRPHRTNR